MSLANFRYSVATSWASCSQRLKLLGFLSKPLTMTAPDEGYSRNPH